MRLNSKSLSKVNLLDVLRRRKTTLNQFLAETGIVTYELLRDRCNSMGVLPPEEEVFFNAAGRKQEEAPKLSSPTEGVIVLDPPSLISEKTGKPVTNFPDLTVAEDSSSDSSDTDNSTLAEIDTASQFRQKKKKV